MEITFYGTRGSIPTPSERAFGFSSDKYGGETTCVSIRSKEGDLYIIDAGSGIRRLGQQLLEQGFTGNGDANLYFSHVHWDHIQGFPFFTPAFIKGNHFKLVGEKKAMTTLERTLEGQQQYPNFPITLEQMRNMGADLEFFEVTEGQEFKNGLQIGYVRLNHPDGVLCYKFDEGDRTFVFGTDTEHDGIIHPNGKYEFGVYDQRLIRWAEQADALVYDGQYTPEEYDPEAFNLPGMSKKTWGHSTYERGVDIAQAAGVKALVLTHHDPNHDDTKLDEIKARAEDYAKKRAPNLEVIMARDGLKLNI